jgi:hypothetical protein
MPVEEIVKGGEDGTYSKVFREPLDTLPFAFFFPVETLGVELVVEAQSLDFAV